MELSNQEMALINTALISFAKDERSSADAMHAAMMLVARFSGAIKADQEKAKEEK